MTTEADTTMRAEWEARLTRYTALRILFEADDLWGPLRQATANMEILFTARHPRQEETPDQMEARKAEAYQHHEAELARHMATIYDPFIEASLALVRTPAPNLAAVQAKHDACNADAVQLTDYEDEIGELFDIIKADVRRLSGVEV